jgi:CheY-like chemotaxis protein
MRFLIVDDSSTMRRIIINTLNKLGHQDVAEAGNGKEGLDRLNAGGPVDVIITDWNMPEMSGIDFIRTMRSTCHQGYAGVDGHQQPPSKLCSSTSSPRPLAICSRPWSSRKSTP